MITSPPGKNDRPHRDPHAGGDRDEDMPGRPADTTASGDATNDTGEDNQRQKGERPADDYIRP
ncbi:hypothetical protein [Frateuria soli]|uniref:hypothetical protein n=1 Tax=Frateuria soli TaxID=1542730 RepID=UPI001E520643|nr:hypothetical protein [Frateuria soli]UGB37667.1 hypothetical protein LQ771_12655 [Frateuria soli]